MYQPSQKGAVCRPISIRPDEKSVAWLPGFLGQLVTIWSIDSYPRRIDAYPRLKRRVSQTFEQETCLLSRSTFGGRFMRQNGFGAKLWLMATLGACRLLACCGKESALRSSLPGQASQAVSAKKLSYVFLSFWGASGQ